MVQSHLPPFQNVGNFVHLKLPVTFGRDSTSRWSLLSGVYVRIIKRSHSGDDDDDDDDDEDDDDDDDEDDDEDERGGWIAHDCIQ